MYAKLGRLESETHRLYAEINIEHKMVGESAQMRAVYQFIAKVARADSAGVHYSGYLQSSGDSHHQL